jgi:general secretion pathway protein D
MRGGELSNTGNFARRQKALRRASCVALSALGLGLLGACAELTQLQDQVKNHDAYSRGPDIMDAVRGINLQPRRPAASAATDQTGGTSAKTQVYAGTTIPAVEGVAVRPGAGGGAGGGDGFELNFENTPIASVAKVVLGDILGTGYTIDPRVMGMISLSSGRPVPRGDLLYVLENALRLSGVVLVKDVQGYRLIPLGDAVGAGNLDIQEARAEPGYGVSVVPLKYISASTLIKLLDSFATKPGTVRADTGRNLLLIQGTGAERRAAIETVLGFDVDWMKGQSVGVFPIHNTAPEPIIGELEKILDSGEGGLSQNTVKLQPITRMNAVLVVTRKPDMLRTVETWIHRLDATDTARASVHVYHVKYGEARQLARVLSEIFTGGGGSFDTPAGQVAPRSGLDRLSSAGGGIGTGTSGGGGGGLGGTGGFGSSSGAGGGGLGGGSGLGGSSGLGGGRSGTGSGATSTFGRQGTDQSGLEGRTAGGGGSGQPLLEGVRITADQAANTLLVYASTENYQLIARTLVQLDKQQLQVAIDATVAEVTLNDALSYGVQAYLQTGKFSFSNVPITSAGAATSTGLPAAAVGGFNMLVGNSVGPNVVIDALHSVTQTKVLQNPSLVVMDNQVATLMVGNDVPVSTGQVASAVTSGTTTGVVNTFDYRSVGIILRVAPRVSANGSVRLEIEQEISGIATGTAAVANSAGNPTFSQRRVKTSVGVQSGQTVLLAGLIQEQQDNNRGGIPWLDQIPNLSDVLSHANKTGARTELIIFLRPQIIRDSQDASFIAEELRSKMRGTIGSIQPYVPPKSASH